MSCEWYTVFFLSFFFLLFLLTVVCWKNRNWGSFWIVTWAPWKTFCLQTSKVKDQHLVEYRGMAYSMYNCPVLAAVGCTMFCAYPFMKFSVHDNFITGTFQWIMAKTFNTSLFPKFSKTEIKICSNIKTYTATIASDFKCFDSDIKPKQ